MSEKICEFWQYLRENDAPNWFVIFFSLLVWPPIVWAIAYWWTKRKRQSVPGFLVTLTPGQKIAIGPQQYDAVLFTFINQTGSTVYLSHAKLRAAQKNFPIPIVASRDLARGWHELTFALTSGPAAFDHYECILQTDVQQGRAFSAIAVTETPKDAFYSYRAGVLRRLFRCPRYFRIDYVVVVADKKFTVAAIY